MPLSHDGAQRASRHSALSPTAPRSAHRPRDTFRTVIRRGAVAGGLALLLTSQAAGVVSATDHDEHRDRVSLKVRAGQAIKDNGLTLKAPPRGQWSFGELLYADGTAEELYLETDRAGRVFATHLGNNRNDAAHAEEATTASGAVASQARISWRSDLDEAKVTPKASDCSSRSYYSYNWKIPSYKWTFDTSTVPWHLRNRTNGTALVLKELKDAVNNITGADNSCGRGDYISATNTYLGWTRRSNGISSGGSCTGGDGYSVVNFGYLPSGVIGMACAYGWSGGYAREGDVRLNLRTKWETHVALCNSETMIQAAATHEFGHVFGLGHAYGSPQTMNPYIPNCSQGPSTLGMGDLTGFERKY